jgi:hypothetical protein
VVGSARPADRDRSRRSTRARSRGRADRTLSRRAARARRNVALPVRGHARKQGKSRARRERPRRAGSVRLCAARTPRAAYGPRRVARSEARQLRLPERCHRAAADLRQSVESVNDFARSREGQASPRSPAARPAGQVSNAAFPTAPAEVV